MHEFYELLKQNPDALKVFIIGSFVIIGLVFFIVANYFGWIKSFKAGKDGISFEANDKKAIEKKFESSNLHNMMNQQIHKLDIEMTDSAMSKSNSVRRILSKQLNTGVYCASSKRALAACMRYPLSESARRNNFKYVLRPENMKRYIGELMKEISSEYEEFSIENDNNTCPMMGTGNRCKQLPPIDEIFEDVRKQIVDYWALPLRREQIKTHYKKIDIYKQYAPMFEQLGDFVMKKVCETCIDKNKIYATALEREPEPNEI